MNFITQGQKRFDTFVLANPDHIQYKRGARTR